MAQCHHDMLMLIIHVDSTIKLQLQDADNLPLFLKPVSTININRMANKVKMSSALNPPTTPPTMLPISTDRPVYRANKHACINTVPYMYTPTPAVMKFEIATSDTPNVFVAVALNL